MRRESVKMLIPAARLHVANPDRVYFLYDKVRSAAVHGARHRRSTRAEARRFTWDVRHALNEYLEYARTARIKRRGQLLTALDQHDRREELVNWLRAIGNPDWETFQLSERR